MILGLGFDVVELARIASIGRKHTLERLFTAEERRQAGGKTAMLAGDFAVKEAVAKAFGTGFRGFMPADIEVLRDALGKPYVCLYGGAKARMEALGIEQIVVSISDTETHAYGMAVAQDDRDEAFSLAAQEIQMEIEEIEKERFTWISEKELCAFVPARRADANKGSYGKLLIVAGCRGMCGAAYLSGLSAYRSGAGLVKIFTHRDNRAIIQTLLPEAIVETWDFLSDEEEDADALSARALTKLRAAVERQLAWADCCILGPGLGMGADARALVETFLSAFAGKETCSSAAASECSAEKLSGTEMTAQAAEVGAHEAQKKAKRPSVLLLDADALNLCAAEERLARLFEQAARSVCTIVTPHPLEMSRLCRQPLDAVLAAPEETAKAFAKAKRSITVLKGAHTLVVRSIEEQCQLYRCGQSSPALAKAGSGDVLTGCIAAMYLLLLCEKKAGNGALAQKDGRMLAWLAAALGVLAHSRAGHLAAEAHGMHGVLARDTADALGLVLEDLRKLPALV